METVIANRIRNHYKTTGFLSKYQHGFRRNEGVEELLALLRLRWARLILKKHVKEIPKHIEAVIHAIFLDIRKAFDKVWHNGLLYKLKRSPWTSFSMDCRIFESPDSSCCSPEYGINSKVC